MRALPAPAGLELFGRAVELDVDVDVDVIGPVTVAALVNGNDIVGVAETVNDAQRALRAGTDLLERIVVMLIKPIDP